MPERPVQEGRPVPPEGTQPDTTGAKPLKAETQNVAENVQQGAQTVSQNVKDEVSAARRPWYHTLMLSRRLIIIYGVLLVVFGVLAGWVYFNPVLPVDIVITKEFQENQSPWLQVLMVSISYLGNVFWLSTLLIIVAALLFWIGGLRLEAVIIVGLCAVSAAVNVAIKDLVNRPRPTSTLVEVITAANGKSFPSGHVMSYVAFFGILFSFGIILFRGNRWWRVLMLIWPGALIVLVGPSRIYLGDHWASDVLGAYVLGFVLLGLALALYLNLKEKGVLATPGPIWRRSPHDPVPRKSTPASQPAQEGT